MLPYPGEKNLANKKSGIPDKSGRFSSMIHYVIQNVKLPCPMWFIGLKWSNEV